MSRLRFSSLIDGVLHLAGRLRAPFLGIGRPLNMSESDLQALFHAYKLRGRVLPLATPAASRILVVAPHPDDETLACGGLVLLNSALADVRLVCIYNGDGGGDFPRREGESGESYRIRLAETRSSELRVNAAELGFSQTLELNVSDSGEGPGPDHLAQLRILLREFRPELIVLPWLFDGHPHHRAASRLVAAAADNLDFTALGYEVWGFLPANCYLDISDVLERKLALMANYQSQTSGIDYVRYCEALARVRAFQHPVRPMRRGAVEAFHRLDGWRFRELALASSDPPPPHPDKRNGD